MGHVIRITSREQYIAITSILDYLPGTWHSRGPTESAVLFVTEEHDKALINAGLVTANGKEENGRGKKQSARSLSPDEGAALLRKRYGGRLAPPLDGLAYRFTIWLPIQAKGRCLTRNTELSFATC